MYPNLCPFAAGPTAKTKTFVVYGIRNLKLNIKAEAMCAAYFVLVGRATYKCALVSCEILYTEMKPQVSVCHSCAVRLDYFCKTIVSCNQLICQLSVMHLRLIHIYAVMHLRLKFQQEFGVESNYLNIIMRF